MGITPNSRIGKVTFYETHISPWATNALAIGLEVAEVTSLGVATGAARTAYNEMIAARAASKAATQNFYNMVEAMHSAPGKGSDMIDTIKNYAQTTDDPNVYTLAEIPPPSEPGTVPPPGTPFDFRLALQQNGAVELKWKCNNPAGAPGTVYEIRRSVDGGEFVTLTTIGERTFLDETVPSTSGQVIYQITAIRSTLRGTPAQFNFRFGSGSGVQSENSGGTPLGLAA
ncbi:MAG: hypothetical protein HND58_12050 [Planctomycetota bacterium]|nr:MAG: hypothetical protein HND58_12050 [Planctomycetota bacterium]